VAASDGGSCVAAANAYSWWWRAPAGRAQAFEAVENGLVGSTGTRVARSNRMTQDVCLHQDRTMEPNGTLLDPDAGNAISSG
jgi:hypothetical protein